MTEDPVQGLARGGESWMRHDEHAVEVAPPLLRAALYEDEVIRREDRHLEDFKEAAGSPG